MALHQAKAHNRDAFVDEYQELLRERFRANKRAFLRLLEAERLVICCKCKPNTFCLRHIAVDILEKIAHRYSVHFERGGEVEPTRNLLSPGEPITDLEHFWQLIENGRTVGDGSPRSQLDYLVAALTKRHPEEIQEFLHLFCGLSPNADFWWDFAWQFPQIADGKLYKLTGWMVSLGRVERDN